MDITIVGAQSNCNETIGICIEEILKLHDCTGNRVAIGGQSYRSWEKME